VDDARVEQGTRREAPPLTGADQQRDEGECTQVDRTDRLEGSDDDDGDERRHQAYPWLYSGASCTAHPSKGFGSKHSGAAALDAGLADSWADTAMAFRRVVKKPALPHFHEFRKAVKRELHQRELSGRPLDRMERATLKKLGDVLGELQDLDIFRDTLRAAGHWRGPVRPLLKQTIYELKGRAIRLGEGRYPEPGS
jgi:CHAD domain-containing protein